MVFSLLMLWVPVLGHCPGSAGLMVKASAGKSDTAAHQLHFRVFAVSLMLFYIDELIIENELSQYPSSQCMVKRKIGLFFFDNFWT